MGKRMVLVVVSGVVVGGCVAGALALNPEQPTGPVDVVGEVPAVEGVVLERVVGGLDRPWSVAWLPEGQAHAEGEMLITERGGRLVLVRDGALVEVSGLPEVLAHGQGGLMDVSLHPEFVENGFVYLTYSVGTPDANRTAMGRGVLDGERLVGFEELFRVSDAKRGGQHFGSRILWLEDGTMLMSVGDGGNPPVRLGDGFIREQAQKLTSDFGKVHRFNDDGSVPSDNPFVGRDGARESIYAYGLRNVQGMALDEGTGRVWVNEHGARGGDELNLLEAGANYGWPEATYSREYWGPRISQKTTAEGAVDPKTVWTPAVAPSGLAFYTGDEFPEWEGDLLTGGLVSEQVRITEMEGAEVVRQSKIDVGKRVRDVRVGPDGGLYILTDEEDGELLRVVRG